MFVKTSYLNQYVQKEGPEGTNIGETSPNILRSFELKL